MSIRDAIARATPGADAVYVLHDTLTGCVKAGISSNPRRRIGEVQRELGRAVIVECVLDGGPELERYLHERWRHAGADIGLGLPQPTEWYVAADDIVAADVALLRSAHDPTALATELGRAHRCRPVKPILLTYVHAAVRIGIAEDALPPLIATGQLDFVELSRQQLYITAASVARHRQEPPVDLRTDELYTTKQAARALATSDTTIRRMFHDGDIPAMRHGGKLKFRRSHLEAFIDEQVNVRRAPVDRVAHERRSADIEQRYPHLAPANDAR